MKNFQLRFRDYGLLRRLKDEAWRKHIPTHTLIMQILTRHAYGVKTQTKQKVEFFNKEV